MSPSCYVSKWFGREHLSGHETCKYAADASSGLTVISSDVCPPHVPCHRGILQYHTLIECAYGLTVQMIHYESESE